MDVLHFKIDQNTISKVLTGLDMETIELFQEGEEMSSYRVKKLAAKFMVTESGEEIPYKRALKIFNDMLVEEYAEGLRQFMVALSDSAVPKANGTPSNSPSEAPTPKPAASPAGSSPSKPLETGDVPPGSSPEKS